MNWYILRVAPNRERSTAHAIKAEGFVTWLPVQLIPVRPNKARRYTAAIADRRYGEKLVYPCAVFVQAEYVPQIGHITREGDRWMQSRDGSYWTVPDHEVRIWAAEIEHLNENARMLGKITKQARRKWKQLHEALAELKDGGEEIQQEAA